MVQWTAQQQLAISDDGHNLLVSSAAGSGKTAVLVERIKNLIINKGVSLSEMLIVTFTKAAAQEMKERLRKEIGESIKACTDEEKRRALKEQLSLISTADIGTFDSFALKIVRNYYHVISVDPSLKICDNYKESILKDEAMEELFSEKYEKEEEDFLDFLDHYSGSKSDKAAREMIAAFCSYADTLPDPQAFLSDPGFDVCGLLELAASRALSVCRKSLAYTRLLISIFEENGIPVCATILKNDVSELDSLIEAFEAGYTEEALMRFCAFTFARLDAKGAEKETKKALDGVIKELRDNGAKKPFANLQKELKGISKESLEQELVLLEKPLSQLSAFSLEFYRRYSKNKQKNKLMDFSDGEHFALDILKNEQVRTELKERYRYIFVDEYQDCNAVQEELINSVSSGNNVFLVGDVKQSIYKFRHALPELFIEKAYLYKSGSDENSKLVELSSNYRSKSGVIDFVNKLFKRLMTKESCGMDYDEDAELKLGIKDDSALLYPPKLYIADSTRLDDQTHSDEEIEELKSVELEAVMAANIIKEYLGRPISTGDGNQKPLEYRDMVILLRKAKGRAEVFYDALTKAGIPVYFERNEGYFDVPEIQVFLNLLRIIDNMCQDLPLISVMHFPAFGFSADELADIRIYAKKNSKKKMSYSKALEFYAENAGDVLAEKCNDFLTRIYSWRIAASALPLGDFLWKLLYDSRIMLYASCLPSAQQRKANLRALVDKAAEFEASDYRGLGSFISYIDLISEDNFKVGTGQSKILGDGDNVVRIMTIHKSKGLEFPFVLVTSCGDSRKGPNQQYRAVWHKDLGVSMELTRPEIFSSAKPLSYSLIKAKESYEEHAEQLRVLYVAATRAKDILIFSGACKDAAKLLSRADFLRLQSFDCPSYLEMILPEFASKDIRVFDRNTLDTSVFALAERTREEVQSNFEKGFEIDESKLSLPLHEIKKRFEFDYSGSAGSASKRKYSVSELARQRREEQGEKIYEFDQGFAVPMFIQGKKKLSSAQIGTAYHKVMEHLPFTPDKKSENDISAFISDLVSKDILKKEESEAVMPSRIAQFFDSEVGKLVVNSEELHKESPFVMKYDYNGNEVMVQGTIDCWFIKEGKLYLLDYKSNYVNLADKDEEIKRLSDDYLPQLELYCKALEKIIGRKPDQAILYLFSAGTEINLKI